MDLNARELKILSKALLGERERIDNAVGLMLDLDAYADSDGSSSALTAYDREVTTLRKKLIKEWLPMVGLADPTGPVD